MAAAVKHDPWRKMKPPWVNGSRAAVAILEKGDPLFTQKSGPECAKQLDVEQSRTRNNADGLRWVKG